MKSWNFSNRYAQRHIFRNQEYADVWQCRIIFLDREKFLCFSLSRAQKRHYPLILACELKKSACFFLLKVVSIPDVTIFPQPPSVSGIRRVPETILQGESIGYSFIRSHLPKRNRYPGPRNSSPFAGTQFPVTGLQWINLADIWYSFNGLYDFRKEGFPWRRG